MPGRLMPRTRKKRPPHPASLVPATPVYGTGLGAAISSLISPETSVDRTRASYQLNVSAREHCPHDSVEKSQSVDRLPSMVTTRQFR
jgi:hypothetical protein